MLSSSVTEPDNFAPDPIFKIPHPESAYVWPNIESKNNIFCCCNFYLFHSWYKIFTLRSYYIRKEYCHITMQFLTENFSQTIKVWFFDDFGRCFVNSIRIRIRVLGKVPCTDPQHCCWYLKVYVVGWLSQDVGGGGGGPGLRGALKRW